MRKKWMLLLGILITFNLNAQQLDRRQGELLIQVRDGLDPTQLQSNFNKFKGKNTGIHLTQVIAQPLNIWKISFDHNKINEFEFNREVNRQKQIEGVSFNYLSNERAVPNDTRFFQQWQYINDGSTGGIPGIDTDADIAWDITTGGLTADGDTIVVCVIDNGVDIIHEDLQDNMWINHAEIPNNGMDDDNNGYVDDYRGWDAINDDDDVTRNADHGTQVAGIVGATGNNGMGVAGVNWNIKIMNVRGGSTVADGIKSYAYAYAQRKLYNDSGGEEGTFVVATNASWGFDRRFRDEAPLFCQMYDELGFVGITNVAATANINLNVDEDGDLPTHCNSPYLIGVTNLSKSGAKVSGAAYSIHSIDLAAPGDNVLTTRSGNNYSNFPGTSGAAPHVTGAIALMHATPCGALAELNKYAWGEAVLLAKDIILGSVTPNDKINDLVLTGGHLNIANAVNIAEELCNPCTPPMQVGIEVDVANAVISWNRNGSGTDIRYRKLGNIAWKTAPSSSSPLIIDDLEDCQRYEIQFRAKCDGNGPYSHSYYFTSENCCQNPESVSVSTEGDDLTIEWDKINVANDYRLEYKTFYDTQWSHIITPDPFFTFSNINSCSGYSFRVRANCDDALPFTRNVTGSINCGGCSDALYCDLDFISNEFEYINSVTIGETILETGINTYGFSKNIGYSGITVTRGQMIDVAIDPGYIGGAFDEYMAIYIDWNQDGVFSEEERAFSPAAASEMVTGQLMVPEDALTGVTRMRVILSYDDIKGTCSDAGLEFGEVEDYCITISNSVACDQTISIESFNTTSTTVELIWTNVSVANDYTVEYRLMGSNEWNSETIMTSSGRISGLERNRNYEFRVKANCTDVNTVFSEIVTILTRLGTSTIDPDGIVNSYLIQPNPFAERLNILLDLNSSIGEIEVELYDLQGRLNLKRKSILRNGQLSLDQLEELISGVYLLHVKGQKFSVMDKVIKI